MSLEARWTSIKLGTSVSSARSERGQRVRGATAIQQRLRGGGPKAMSNAKSSKQVPRCLAVSHTGRTAENTSAATSIGETSE